VQFNHNDNQSRSTRRRITE